MQLGTIVRIGSHDASNQTFDKNNHGKYILHNKKPKNAGCVKRKNQDGTRTKLCNLEKKH